MDKKLWLQIAARFSFYDDVPNSHFPLPAAYFAAPPPLLENRVQLVLVGEVATLIFAIFGLYALSGAGSIRHLLLLRLGLIRIRMLLRNLRSSGYEKE